MSRTRPYIPDAVTTDPSTYVIHLPEFVWKAIDRQRSGNGLSTGQVISVALNREFRHLKNNGRGIRFRDDIEVTFYGQGWASIALPPWIAIELELQAKTREEADRRLLHSIRLQALGVRMMQQLSLFDPPTE